MKFDEIQSAESAREQFKAIIDRMKVIGLELMKTRSGRDSIRRDWGCSIEGFDEENEEWNNKHPWSEHK